MGHFLSLEVGTFFFFLEGEHRWHLGRSWIILLGSLSLHLRLQVCGELSCLKGKEWFPEHQLFDWNLVSPFILWPA